MSGKLKSATDVVQDHLNELSNKSRPAAGVRRLDIFAVQGHNAFSQDKTDNQSTAAKKPKQG